MKKPMIYLFTVTSLAALAVLGTLGRAQSEYIPTYYVDVQPILEKNCVPCHVAGGIAPFALDNPKDAVLRANEIAEVTRDEYMPPFPPSRDSQPFYNERRLGIASKKILDDWAKAKAPLGRAPRK